MSIPKVIRGNDERALRATSVFEGAPSPLIKAGVIREVADLQERIDAMWERAQEQLAAAKAEEEAIRESARQEGYQAGLSQLTEALGRASAEYDRRVSASEQDMLALALALTERLVGHAVSMDERVVQGMVAGVLEHVRGKRQVLVYANPEDVPALEAAAHEFSRRLDGASLYVEANPELTRGGCVIETESGRVDARLEVQLDALRSALTGGT